MSFGKMVGLLLLVVAISAGSGAEKPSVNKVDLSKIAGRWFWYKQPESMSKYSCGDLVVNSGSGNYISWSVNLFNTERKEWTSFSGMSQSSKESKFITRYWKPANESNIFSELVEQKLDVLMLKWKHNNYAVLRFPSFEDEPEGHVILSRQRGFIYNEDALKSHMAGNLIEVNQRNCTTYSTLGGL